MHNENVLSRRYATPEMNDIFSERGRLRAERELWIAVMKAQHEAGVRIPLEEIAKYEKAIDDIDPEWIEKRERETRHDVKAKIEAFVKAAGAKEYIHKGMTSRDLTDNVEQMQIKKAAKLIFGKYVAILADFQEQMLKHRYQTLTARTHHQAAQPTLLGRRITMWAEELLLQVKPFEDWIEKYPLRGIKGPVGTQADMVSLLGSPEKVYALERKVAKLLGFEETLTAPGQVYPRSLDYMFLSHLALLTAGCENFALGMRLMAGYELVTEGFKEGQVGSSAMPHKMNTRSSERVWSLAEMIKMYADGASRLSGSQWEEGDVSCSALRRIIIPDSCYASDGLCETTLTVLGEMGAYPEMINQEVLRYLPFLTTTNFLSLATGAGIGREQAHEIIKGHAVAEALRMKKTGISINNLPRLLAEDPSFVQHGITREQIDAVLSNKGLVGNAEDQMLTVYGQINMLVNRFPKEAAYKPQEIL